MKYVAAIPLGMLICTTAMCLFGGIEAGFQFLALSIVCTAGMGLIVWIPLWFVIGAGTLAAFSAIAGGYKEPGGSSDTVDVSNGKPASTTTFASSDEWSLADFIQRAKQRGLQPEQVNQILQNAGWSLEEIEQARGRLRPTPAKT